MAFDRAERASFFARSADASHRGRRRPPTPAPQRAPPHQRVHLRQVVDAEMIGLVHALSLAMRCRPPPDGRPKRRAARPRTSVQTRNNPQPKLRNILRATARRSLKRAILWIMPEIDARAARCRFYSGAKNSSITATNVVYFDVATIGQAPTLKYPTGHSTTQPQYRGYVAATDRAKLGPQMSKFSEFVPLSSITPFNLGLSSATQETMISLLGRPKLPLTAQDQPDHVSDT